jgi:3-methyladenine DNA glycosylase AlkD
MGMLTSFRKELQALGSLEKAAESARFFKIGPGQYGEGDTFIGVTVPEVRGLTKRYSDFSLRALEMLLTSSIHEERLSALIVLDGQFDRGDDETKRAIYDFYLSHTKWINNWDLVDSSAEFIIGPWLADKDKKILEQLARSPLIWERRIAMLATFDYIKKGSADEALKVITILLHDDHDLIQKATGWMLREIGKRCSEDIEKAYLDKHYRTMPRTTLRYAIERFPAELKTQYLKGTRNI